MVAKLFLLSFYFLHSGMNGRVGTKGVGGVCSGNLLVKQRIMFNLPCFGDFADFVAVPYDFENKNLD